MQNTTATSTVLLNGEQAKKELSVLAQRATALRQKLKEANEAGDSKAWNRYAKELKECSKAQAQMTKEAFDVKRVLDNLSGSSLRDLTKAQKQLTAEMNSGSIQRSTAAWTTHQEKLKAVKIEIASINAETKDAGSAFNRFAEWTNKSWQLFAAAGMAIVGVTTVLKKYMDMRNELEDTTANLKALTGLEDKDVNKLTKWAEQMASNPLEGTGIRIRSSVNEIMEAYKLVGSAKPELLSDAAALNEVTKQSMILAAAAGMPLSEAVIGTTTALNQYGAGADKAAQYVNALGAGAKFGAVEVPYIAEALTKFGALAKDANVPIEQSIAAIETLGAKGFQAEITGTGLKMMFVKMMTGAKETNPAIVGMSKALDNLNEKFSGPGGFHKMVAMFGEREVVVVRSLIAEREQFNKLTNDVTGTTTAIEQATIASNTNNAKIAQATNGLNILAMELVANVSPAVLKVANLTTVFLKVLVQLPAWLKENAGLLITLAGVMTTYTIAIQVSAIAEKGRNSIKAISIALEKAETIGTLALAAAKALFTGNITRAQAAMKLLTAEMSINPYVALGLVIASITIGLYKWLTAQTEVQKAWKDFNVESKIEIETADQLFTALKKTTQGTNERKLLIDKINTQYGQYLTNQLSEKSNLDDIAQAQKTVNFALRDKIAIQTKDTAKAEIIKKYAEPEFNAVEGIKAAAIKAAGEASGTILVGEIMKKLDAEPDLMVLTQKSVNKDLWQRFGWKAKDITDFIALYVTNRKEVAQKMAAIDERFKGIIAENYDPLKASGPEIVVTGHKKVDTSIYDDVKDVKAGKNAKKEDPHKVELAEVDAWIAKEQAKFKKRHLENMDSEEVYQINLVNISREALLWKQSLYKSDEKEFADYKNQILDIDLKRQDDANTLSVKAEKDLFEGQKNIWTEIQRVHQTKIELELQAETITQEEYNNKKLGLEATFAKKQWQEALNHQQRLKTLIFNTEAEKTAAFLEADKAVETAAKNLQSNLEAIELKNAADRKAIAKEVAEIEKKYGIDSKKSKHKEYSEGLAELKTAFQKELLLWDKNEKKKAEITAKYEKNVAKLKLKNAEQTAQDISDIASKGSEMVNKLQEMETLHVENMYAGKLKAAKGNAEETAKIEAEMEAEKLAVKKKYADIDFAMTTAKIITSTALAIMKALETDGIAGPILAGVVAATGLVEIGVANEQRKAVQNLWTGGYTEDGGKYEPRGIVHAGEFVAAQEAVKNTPLRQVFNLVDYAQKTNTVARITSEDIARSIGVRNGYASGGFTTSQPSVTNHNGITPEQLAQAIKAANANNVAITAELLRQLQNGITANVSVSGKNGIAEKTNIYNKLLNNAQR